MDNILRYIDNIDNHNQLIIVPGKLVDTTTFVANIGEEKLESIYHRFVKEYNINKDDITLFDCREYINDGITLVYHDDIKECYEFDNNNSEFIEIDNVDYYVCLRRKTNLSINSFPIDKEMDDIKDKSEIRINIDNLFHLVFLTYNDKVYYYKFEISKYNIYKEKVIQKLSELLSTLKKLTDTKC